jgi:hypothetical protein
MGLAAIAMLGVLLSPQDLAVQSAGTFTPPLADLPASLALDASALASTTAGEGTMAMSSQTLTSSVSQVSFTGGADMQGSLRTGDINLGQNDASGFSGMQAVNISTGFGSSVQSAISIAAGSVAFGPKT